MSDTRWSWFGSNSESSSVYGGPDHPIVGFFVIVFCIAIMIGIISVPAVAYDKAKKLNEPIQKKELLKETDICVKTLIERNKFIVSGNDLKTFNLVCNTQKQF
jgi:hypothetical protein